MDFVSVFKNEESEARYMAAYDAILARWPVPYETRYVSTRLGETHVIASGEKDAPPLALLPEEASSAHSDILWLSELVQATGNKLTYGFPFLKKDVFDYAGITAALLVMEAWSYCDPTVESLLTSVQ